MTTLEFLRRTRGLSQAELGKELLYSRQLIAQLEKGNRPPGTLHPRLRKTLEDYFDLPLTVLLSRADPSTVLPKESMDLVE